MTYTAITIGPIIKTLSLARKPRELWSASYLFSHLMRCIINAVPKEFEIISPAKLEEKRYHVGLYPDRVFIKNMELIQVKEIIEHAKKTFAEKLKLKCEVDDYFKIMCVSFNSETDGDAVKTLNEKLDIMESCCTPSNNDSSQDILNLVKMTKDSPLFDVAFKSKNFPIKMLAEIASAEISNLKPEEWNNARVQLKMIDKNDQEESTNSNEEEAFYQQLKEQFPGQFKTYHKFICVVQADGDNMGSVVSNLPDGQLSILSKDLLNFGEGVCESIKAFGGLPIYAGGDDLLFIAPVVGKTGHSIFDLIDEIDVKYKDVRDKVENYHLLKDEKPIKTSMSFGVSISYYKFPLYEALASARNLLFKKAKHVKGKNTVVWNLQKNGGSSFYGQCSKSDEVYTLFKKVIETTSDENLVSAVAHKIRANKALLGLWIDKEPEHILLRLDAFYDKTLEYASKSMAEQNYLTATKNLLLKLYNTKDIEQITREIYGMLRTAKYIKGEEDNHE